jgi:hypothetical protein
MKKKILEENTLKKNLIHRARYMPGMAALNILFTTLPLIY